MRGKQVITASAWIINDTFRTSVPVSMSGLLVLLTSQLKGGLPRVLSRNFMAAPRVSDLVAYLLVGLGWKWSFGMWQLGSVGGWAMLYGLDKK